MQIPKGCRADTGAGAAPGGAAPTTQLLRSKGFSPAAGAPQGVAAKHRPSPGGSACLERVHCHEAAIPPGHHGGSLCASRAARLLTKSSTFGRPSACRQGRAGQGRQLRSTAARSLKRRALIPPSDWRYNGRGNTSAPALDRARYWWKLFLTTRNPTALTHPAWKRFCASTLRLPRLLLSCASGIAAARLPPAAAGRLNAFDIQPVTFASAPVF